MKKLSSYIIERFIAKPKAEPIKISSEVDLYNYIVNKYNLKRIQDFREAKKCPDILDMTDIEVSENCHTDLLFPFFKCSSIDISTWKIKKIGVCMFQGCKFKKFEIPSTVTIIAVGAFEHCVNLEEIVIPEGVQRISNEAFKKCENLKSIFIPSSVVSFGDAVFSGSFRLTKITTPKGNGAKLKSLLATSYKTMVEEI